MTKMGRDFISAFSAKSASGGVVALVDTPLLEAKICKSIGEQRVFRNIGFLDVTLNMKDSGVKGFLRKAGVVMVNLKEIKLLAASSARHNTVNNFALAYLPVYLDKVEKYRVNWCQSEEEMFGLLRASARMTHVKQAIPYVNKCSSGFTRCMAAYLLRHRLGCKVYLGQASAQRKEYVKHIFKVEGFEECYYY